MFAGKRIHVNRTFVLPLHSWFAFLPISDDPPEVESVEYYEKSDELKIFFKNGLYVSEQET